MTDSPRVLLSVRGEAREFVTPDYCVLAGTVETSAQSKEHALQLAAAAQDRLVTDLASLGGVPFRRDTEHRPLTWAARSATTMTAHDKDRVPGRREPAERVLAQVHISITVRAFERLGPLGSVLAAHDRLHIFAVSWHVDADNPGWHELRAAAIKAAVRKARDYAAALGGELHHAEHIADAGLLDGGNAAAEPAWAQHTALMSAGGGEPDAPSLDPVPQELAAVIDARFVAVGVSLP